MCLRCALPRCQTRVRRHPCRPPPQWSVKAPPPLTAATTPPPTNRLTLRKNGPHGWLSCKSRWVWPTRLGTSRAQCSTRPIAPPLSCRAGFDDPMVGGRVEWVGGRGRASLPTHASDRRTPRVTPYQSDTRHTWKIHTDNASFFFLLGQRDEKSTQKHIYLALREKKPKIRLILINTHLPIASSISPSLWPARIQLCRTAVSIQLFRVAVSGLVGV